jgi:putative spermidine/putrescine transport system ATP-binding protein
VLYNEPQTTFVAGFVGITNYIPSLVDSSSEVQVLGQILDISEHSASVKKGEEVRALVRPESIHVEKSSHGATVITKSFLGPMTRVGVDAGLGVLIYAEMSSKEAKKFDTGDHVKLSISTEAVMVKNV